jgi:hypothetical protein
MWGNSTERSYAWEDVKLSMLGITRPPANKKHKKNLAVYVLQITG